MAERARLLRLAGAAQCRLHGLHATALLARLCEARLVPGDQRAHVAQARRAERRLGAERLVAALRATATDRLEIVEQLHDCGRSLGWSALMCEHQQSISRRAGRSTRCCKNAARTVVRVQGLGHWLAGDGRVEVAQVRGCAG